MYWDLENGKSYRVNGESFREFYVKLISGFQIKLAFSVFRKIGKTSEAAF